MFFVSNKAVEASSWWRENKHLGGRIFKNIVFLYNTIYFSSKMGYVTVFIYVFIILILYLFLNHFSVYCMCGFVSYKAVNSTVSKSFLYVSESFPQQNFHFGCTYGRFFGYGKGKNLQSSKTIPQIHISKFHSLKIKKGKIINGVNIKLLK